MTGRFPLAMAAETLAMFRAVPPDTITDTRAVAGVGGGVGWSRPSIGNHKVDASSKLILMPCLHLREGKGVFKSSAY